MKEKAGHHEQAHILTDTITIAMDREVEELLGVVEDDPWNSWEAKQSY